MPTFFSLSQVFLKPRLSSGGRERRTAKIHAPRKNAKNPRNQRLGAAGTGQSASWEALWSRSAGSRRECLSAARPLGKLPRGVSAACGHQKTFHTWKEYRARSDRTRAAAGPRPAPPTAPRGARAKE